MLYKVIATPADYGAGDWQGWVFSPDDGRVLNVHELRITYNPCMRDHWEKILKQAMRDYKASIDDNYKQYKASKQYLEYTQKMRAWRAERDKFIREGRELKHTSL